MLTIDITAEQLHINGQPIRFPAPIATLRACLGECRHTLLKYNQIYTWDALGVMAYSHDGEVVETLHLSRVPEKLAFHPRSVFSGALLLEGQEAMAYRQNHADKLVKLYKGDRGKAFFFGEVCVQLVVEGQDCKSIDLSAREHPATEPAGPPAALDEAFAYLRPVVAQWVAEIHRIVPTSNEYNTLTTGVDAGRIASLSALSDSVRLPQELVNFYKLVDVDYHPVTSAVLLVADRADYGYSLEAFDDIPEAWAGIQALCEGSVEEKLLQDYSPRVKATGYANPAWIPFAHDYSGNYLLYDTDPSPVGRFGQIIELDNESWQRTVVADSLSELIERNTHSLRAGQISALAFVLKGK